MSFDRSLLAILGAFVFFAGVGCLVAPASLAQQAGFSASASGLTEIRAFYGGLQIGVGCFLIACLRDQALVSAGLLLEGMAVAGAGIARALGMVIEGSATTYHLANFAVEVTTVALVVMALFRRREVPHATTSSGGRP